MFFSPLQQEEALREDRKKREALREKERQKEEEEEKKRLEKQVLKKPLEIVQLWPSTLVQLRSYWNVDLWKSCEEAVWTNFRLKETLICRTFLSCDGCVNFLGMLGTLLPV